METIVQVLRRVTLRVLGVDVVIFIVVALIAGATPPLTAFTYGSGLFFFGGICCALGFLVTAGSFNNRGNWKYQLGRSVSDANLSERTMQDVNERTVREGFAVIMAIAGLVAALAGIVIQSIRI